MKNQILLIALIIGLGSFFSIAYSVSTVITDSSITTTNLTILGTCSGCGGGGSIQTYTVTSADTAGSDVLTISNFTQISGQILSNSTYDGRIDFQIQRQNGVYDTINSLSGSGNTVNFIGSQYGTGNSILIDPDLKYPYNMRFEINTQATTGNATITIKSVS